MSQTPEDGENKIDISKEFFQILSENGFDKIWLQKKSESVLHNILLKPWFEKGSQRYSFDNLGNLKIEKSEMLE